jgi:hypothetical protein
LIGSPLDPLRERLWDSPSRELLRGVVGHEGRDATPISFDDDLEM